MLGLFLIFVCGIFSISVNFNQFLWNSPPTLLGTLATLVFLLTWISLSIIMGWQEKKLFNLVTTLYWGVGLMAYIVGSNFPRSILYSVYSFVVLLCFGPLYGLAYFLPIENYLVLTLVLAFIPWVLSLWAYFIGKFLKSYRKE
ncbi:CDP-diglyceride synthetase [Anaerosolibacter carboniphilus]|uniref:CDP-diglyceride synthetase n=1 Tax=Anaerosolibacter carboniphilus TaxID=1417629 RepID=A0A841KXC1_9FIRM|nr:hypothetical protein [Anaerosolibacter carboniphilus]MBB6218091.1 CDP-diglyceride synthetase [Anaerosolibacter carboniphilus]